MSERDSRTPVEEVLVRDGIEYEEVSQDDTVIGRAFRISLAAFALVAAGIVGVVWYLRREPPPPPAKAAGVEPARTVTHDVVAPSVRFSDVTEASGITFVHQNGAEGERLLPETMGGGAAFLDHDADGDPDLLLVNGCFWPESKRAASERPTQALYANDGKGRFSDMTKQAGLDVTFYGMGAAAADADCDGDQDVFFTAVGPNHYFANDGGRFVERDAGVAGDATAWSTCAAFFDAERDGDLDLFVGNYVRWSREIDINVDYRLTGIGRAYGPPMNFEGAQPYFYRNDGSGRFADATEAAGLHVTNPATGVPVGKTLGARPCDSDGDGDLDLMVANDTVSNFFFVNQGDGTFTERGNAFGLAFDRDGRARGAMGVDAAWFRNDAALAIAIGNFANEMTSFFVSQARPDLWTDEAIGAGVGAPSRKFLKFGLVFLDYDLDGRLDLLQTNGHIEDEINAVQVSQTYEQPALLLWNAGPAERRTFVEVDAETTGDLCRPIVGRGLAVADIDGDGDQDVLMTQVGRRPLLLENDQALGHHWVRLALRARGCNRDAIGARVELEAGSVKQTQELVPCKSYLSQVELPLTFGLGASTKVERVTIRWPDGARQVIDGLEVDRLHVIEQPE